MKPLCVGQVTTLPFMEGDGNENMKAKIESMTKAQLLQVIEQLSSKVAPTSSKKKSTSKSNSASKSKSKAEPKVKDTVDKKLFTTSIKGVEKNVKIRSIFNIMMYHFDNNVKNYKKALLEVLNGGTFTSKTTKVVTLKKGVTLTEKDIKDVLAWEPQVDTAKAVVTK
jgi:hypothetical protein